jgi:hypothetical protein
VMLGLGVAIAEAVTVRLTDGVTVAAENPTPDDITVAPEVE